MTSCTGSAPAEDLEGFEKVKVGLSPASEEDGLLSRIAEARRICALRAPHEIEEGRWKIQNMYLSLYVGEPLNSKVIKIFVPELRSRKCFSCFEIPIFYVYIYMNIICPFRISVSGYGTNIR